MADPRFWRSRNAPLPGQRPVRWSSRSRLLASTTLRLTCVRENGPRRRRSAASSAPAWWPPIQPTGFPAARKWLPSWAAWAEASPAATRSLPASPSPTVLPVTTELPWEELAAIPESYATAWVCLHGNLALAAGQTIVVRGATSALGQAAVNIAAHAGARVIATTRNAKRVGTLEAIGAKETMIETPELSTRVRE